MNKEQNIIESTNAGLSTKPAIDGYTVLPAVPSSEVYLEDCVKALKRFNDNHFDLAIVDPPYGLERFKANDGGNSKKITTFGDKDKNWNNIKPTAEYWKELFRVSKNQIVWGGNYFIEYLKNTRCFIFWDKKNGTNFMSDGELAWTSFDSSVRRYAYNHIQDFNKGIDRIHPTQKPIDLYTFCLINYAKEGDLILDTHLGSGSSRIAAYKGGFNFVGFEIDQEYYEKQEKRFNDFKSQLRLF